MNQNHPVSISPLLDEFISDLSVRFNDAIHTPSNRKRMYNLWTTSSLKLSEEDFRDLMYEARYPRTPALSGSDTSPVEVSVVSSLLASMDL